METIHTDDEAMFVDEQAVPLAGLRAVVESGQQAPKTDDAALAFRGLTEVLDRDESPLPVSNLHPERIAARQDQIISNYLRHYGTAGSDGSALEDFTPLDHQPRIFRKLGEAMADGPDETGSIKIGMRAAPNVGKGVILPICARAMGIGEVVAEDEPPLSGIYIVPSLQTLYQMAEDETRGFLAHAPDIDLGKYYSFAKEISDMTVITDKSLLELSDEKFQELLDRIDVIFIDEVHRSYGERIQARIKQLMAGKVTIAASATTDLNGQRNLETELGISNMAVDIGFREAIEDKIANGAQILALATNSHLEVSHSDGPTEADLMPLSHDRERNSLIVETLQYATESGRPGLTRCIHGESSWHARAIAKAASEIIITDPNTGLQRPMVVKAVGNFQSRAENKAVLDAFSRGDVDQITFSRYLIEGYDEKRVAFVFNTQPSSSIADVDQLFGRGMRFNDKLTLYIELIDSFAGRGRPMRSFFDTVGEEVAEQGITIGQAGRPKKQPSESGSAPFNGPQYDPKPESPDMQRNEPMEPSPTFATPGESVTEQGSMTDHAPDSSDKDKQKDDLIKSLPLRLRKASAAIHGRVVRELMVVGLDYEVPPPDWKPVSTLSISKQLTRNSLLQALRRLEIPLKQKSRGEWFGPPDLEEQAAKIDIAVMEGDLIPIEAFAAALGVGKQRAGKIIEQLDLPVLWRRHPKTKKPVRFVTETVRDIALEHIGQEPQPYDESRDIRASQVAKIAGRNLNSVRLAAGELGITLRERLDRNGSTPLCIDRDEVEPILDALRARRYLRGRSRKTLTPPTDPVVPVQRNARPAARKPADPAPPRQRRQEPAPILTPIFKPATENIDRSSWLRLSSITSSESEVDREIFEAWTSQYPQLAELLTATIQDENGQTVTILDPIGAHTFIVFRQEQLRKKR